MEELKSIEDMLPHSGVMILVDEILFIDEVEITTKSLDRKSVV